MDNTSDLQKLVSDQLERGSKWKQRPPLVSNSLVPTKSKLTFTDTESVSSLGSLQTPKPSSVVLQYDPHLEYPKKNRTIKHSTDKFVIDTDYKDRASLASTVRGSTSQTRRTQKKHYPDFASLSSSSDSVYWKGKAKSRGSRMGKVTLAKLEFPSTEPDQHNGSFGGIGFEHDNLSLTSMQSKSVDDLFSSVFMDREETNKQLDSERVFTSKVATPRLIKSDENAHFKSKDLLNGLIEDISSKSSSF